MYTKKDIINIIGELYESVPGNILDEDIALEEGLVGVKLFDAPSVGFGSAADPLYDEFKDPRAIGPWHMTPREWFPEARTVVSVFFPFTEEIRSGNRVQTDGPSPGWLQGRIEGQNWLFAFIRALKERFAAEGTDSCVPALDPRWFQIRKGMEVPEYDCANERTYGSNWSERHTAYVCGLGTFGLSKGVITERGMAGRFTSIIIPVSLEPDPRRYTDIYEWCVMCGACTQRCPAGAITIEKGKDHILCQSFLEGTKLRFSPRYGCGLCQTGVPCESCAPGMRA